MQAKRQGGDCARVYTRELEALAPADAVVLEAELRRAIANDEIEVFYQPIIRLADRTVAGFEALLRWRHPEQGLIFPNQFVPQLEELGLMAEVGNWVLRTACMQNAAWQKAGLPPIRVMVNLSSTQFYRCNIASNVMRALSESGLDPKWLELELTESLMLDDSETTIKIMRTLRRLGVSLSLDDFRSTASRSIVRSCAISRRSRPRRRWCEASSTWAAIWALPVWPKAWKRRSSLTTSGNRIAKRCRDSFTVPQSPKPIAACCFAPGR